MTLRERVLLAALHDPATQRAAWKALRDMGWQDEYIACYASKK